MKRCIIILLTMITFLVMLASCGGGGLDGTWGLQSEHARCRIVFRGNRFTLTEYHSASSGTNRSGRIMVGHRPMFGWTEVSAIPIVWGGPVFAPQQQDVTSEWGFSDNTFAAAARHTIQGTFSITDCGDRIEITFPDGWIEVFRFSQTENTITIGGTTLVRRNAPDDLPHITTQN